MKVLGVPRRRARELHGALAGAGISLDAVSVTGGNHVRLAYSAGGVIAGHNAALTPGDRRDLLNTLRGAKRALRERGAEI